MPALTPTFAVVALLLSQVPGFGTPSDDRPGVEAKAAAYTGLSAGGHCQRGGKARLTVTRLETTYHLEAVLTGIENGRWRGGISESSGTRPFRFADVVFDSRVSNGRLTVTGDVRQLEQPDFQVVAFGPGKLDVAAGRLCSVYLTGDPLVAIGGCRSVGMKSMLAQAFRRDGGTVVRWMLAPVARQSSWTVEIAAETDAGGESVGRTGRPNRNGVVRGREHFDGMANPVVTVVARSKRGQVCSVQVRRTLASPAQG
jgi:hypothetical protein